MFKKLVVGVTPQPFQILTLRPDNMPQVPSLLAFGGISQIPTVQRLMNLQPVLFISRMPTIHHVF